MKTYFLFKSNGMYILVSNNKGVSRSGVYGKFPAQVIDVLENIGYVRV